MTQAQAGVPPRRSSPGGNVVTGSLSEIGYVQPPSVALVETARPRRRAYNVVLSQNAWNFVSPLDFRSLSAGYGTTRRGLYRARRVVAGVNTARAGSTITLSHYMASLIKAHGHDSLVAPVTLPIELCTTAPPSERRPSGIYGPFIVVPGTLTPYKNAAYALTLAELLEPQDRPMVVLAGTDDGSGESRRLTDRLVASGLSHWIGPVDREGMSWLLRHAIATVVPTRLESLSFSIAEALALSPHVLASPLPVHVEVAERLGRHPVWLPEVPDRATARRMVEGPSRPAAVDRRPFRDEWHALAELLQDLAEQR